MKVIFLKISYQLKDGNTCFKPPVFKYKNITSWEESENTAAVRKFRPDLIGDLHIVLKYIPKNKTCSNRNYQELSSKIQLVGGLEPFVFLSHSYIPPASQTTNQSKIQIISDFDRSTGTSFVEKRRFHGPPAWQGPRSEVSEGFSWPHPVAQFVDVGGLNFMNSGCQIKGS